jgi:hypothetical protein
MIIPHVRHAVVALVLLEVTGCDDASSPRATPLTPAASASAVATATTASSGTANTTTVIGVARDVKGGAAIVADDGTLTRIDGLDAWPKNLVDRRVIAEGVMKKHPGAACVNDPLPCQGIGDDYWVLADAKFRLE